MGGAVTMFVQLLPLAVGAALSPTLLVLQVAILSGPPPPLARSWALAAGRMTALAVITVGGTSLLARLPDFDVGSRPSTPLGVVLCVAGTVLLVVAAQQVTGRRDPSVLRSGGGGPAERTRREGIVAAPPPYLFVVGAAWMLVNASTLALYVPGMHVVSHAQVGWPVRVAGLLVLFVAASAAAVVPPLLVTLDGDSARARLERVRSWTEANSRRIEVAVASGFGVALIGFGAWNLAATR